MKNKKLMYKSTLMLYSGKNNTELLFWRYKMAGYLISETTREEREKIVAESLGNIEANCDGCMAGLAEMYQDYIEGKKELRQINMEFNARYVKGEDMPGRNRCPM